MCKESPHAILIPFKFDFSSSKQIMEYARLKLNAVSSFLADLRLKRRLKENHLSKIGKLEHAIIGDQQIARFHIPMHDHIPVTSIKTTQNLDHPPLQLPGRKPPPRFYPVRSSLLRLRYNGGQIRSHKLENKHGILILAPKVLVQNDDIRRTLKDLKRLDFAERRLIIVDLLQGDDNAIGEPPRTVDIGISAGSDPLEDLVLLDDIRPSVDAPALGR